MEHVQFLYQKILFLIKTFWKFQVFLAQIYYDHHVLSTGNRKSPIRPKQEVEKRLNQTWTWWLRWRSSLEKVPWPQSFSNASRPSLHHAALCSLLTDMHFTLHKKLVWPGRENRLVCNLLMCSHWFDRGWLDCREQPLYFWFTIVSWQVNSCIHPSFTLWSLNQACDPSRLFA